MGNTTRRKAIGGALCLLLATRICVLSRKEAASGAITNTQSNATHSPGIGFLTKNCITLPFLSTS